jgi:molybdate transport system substrate-binding protein
MPAMLAAVALALAGCAGEPAGGADDVPVPGDVAGTVHVFAAASLTDVLTTLAIEFEAAHPDVTVVVSYAGSATLAAQINQGAPADVFISANPETMATVVDAGNAVDTPHVLVRNELVIAVPAGNPHQIRSLADLADPAMKVAVCAAQVPCGAATAHALDVAGVELTPVTLEQDVRGALSKVILGEVDAALVYRTDAAATDAVDGIEFPESAEAVNDYPAVVLAAAANLAGGRAFLDHLRSEQARASFETAGFLVP